MTSALLTLPRTLSLPVVVLAGLLATNVAASAAEPTPTPSPTPGPDWERHIDVDPGDCTFVFERDLPDYDYRTAGGLARNIYPGSPADGTTVICGGPGDDWVFGLDGGTFVGGEGNDFVEYVLDGTFDGGSGADSVDIMIGGRFDGGDDNDSVGRLDGGVFSGGQGSDRVELFYAGTFSGGRGPDRVEHLGDDPSMYATSRFGADAPTFDGGPGRDFAGRPRYGSFHGGNGVDTLELTSYMHTVTCHDVERAGDCRSP